MSRSIFKQTRPSKAQKIGRLVLGGALIFAGVSHLTISRYEFQAQVPTWVPVDVDKVVIASGAAEIALGTALVALPRKSSIVGWIAAGFFAAVFPGNISQMTTRTSAFGLNTDRKRQGRLLFQPVLIAWSLWSTGAAKALRKR